MNRRVNKTFSHQNFKENSVPNHHPVDGLAIGGRKESSKLGGGGGTHVVGMGEDSHHNLMT